MERFTTIPRITKGQLKQANTVRLYLRVITIADLTDPEDSTIPYGMLTGDWQAGSDLHGLTSHAPLNSTGQHSENASTQPLAHLHQNTNHHISASALIDRSDHVTQSLNTWYPCYKSASQLFLRQHDTPLITIMTASKVKGYYHATGTATALPLTSHPITYQHI